MIRTLCANADVALFATPLPSASIVDQLRGYLSRQLAERIALHGVLMDVLGVGVFITGDSGAGKSELALELISRGHGLVADDIVEFSRIAPNLLVGRCPELLQDVIEVRGLGILNVRTIFGETACRKKMKLKLVVHLQRRQASQDEPLRLTLEGEEQNILGVPIRRVVDPTGAGDTFAGGFVGFVARRVELPDHFLRTQQLDRAVDDHHPRQDQSKSQISCPRELFPKENGP